MNTLRRASASIRRRRWLSSSASLSVSKPGGYSEAETRRRVAATGDTSIKHRRLSSAALRRASKPRGGVSKRCATQAVACLFFLFSLNTAYAQTPEANKKTDKFAEAYANADEAIERNRLTNSFFAVGPTIGLPSGLNLNASLYLWRFVVRGSGMFYGSDFMGGQADVGFSLFNGARIRHSASFVGGYMRRKPLFALDSALPDNKTGVSQESTYLGGAYELFMDGFFLQVGVGRALADEVKNPMLIFQAGYLFAFP